jgi:hypothetical protein
LSICLLEKLTGLQPVKKFPKFYGTRQFITTFTIACHLSLPSASSGRTKLSVQIRGKCSCFVTKTVFTVRCCQHLSQHLNWNTTPLSALRNCLFNVTTATHHIGSCSCVHNLRAHHAIVTGTHLSQELYTVHSKKAENLFKALIDCIKCIICQV